MLQIPAIYDSHATCMIQASVVPYSCPLERPFNDLHNRFLIPLKESIVHDIHNLCITCSKLACIKCGLIFFSCNVRFKIEVFPSLVEICHFLSTARHPDFSFDVIGRLEDAVSLPTCQKSSLHNSSSMWTS